MIFTMIGTVLSWLITAYGVLLVATGFLIASDPSYAEYWPFARNTGAAIDRGFVVILVGIAFGVLTEISRRLAEFASGSSGDDS